MVCMEKTTLIAGFLLLMFSANAQNDQKLLLSGNEMYKEQQFEKALEQYKKATELEPGDAKAHYNLGNALYKTKKLEEATIAFDSAADNSTSPVMRSKALYNKGVSLTRQSKLVESIEAYKSALRVNSTDQQARENLQKAINELKKNSQNQNNNNNKNKQDKKKQPEPQKNNSKLNQKQVEQMLNALRQDEKKLQQNIQKRNNTGGSNSKDW